MALYYSPDLDVARAHLRTAQAGIVTANTRPNPSLGVGGGYTNAPESPLVFYFTPSVIMETGGKRAIRTLEAGKLAEAARAWMWMPRRGALLSRVRAAWVNYAMALRSVDVLNNEIRARNGRLSRYWKNVSASARVRGRKWNRRARC